MLSRLALIGIGLDGLFGLMDVVFGAGFIAFPSHRIDLDGDDMSVWLLAIGMLTLLKFPVYTFAVVTFLMWIYRAYTNLPALRSDSFEFSPGWAVGWWFIPFANLIKPFQAVRNLWNESDPDFDGDPGFMSGIQGGAPGFMAFWWGAWLLSNFVANIAGGVFDPEQPSSLGIGAILYMAAGGLTAIAALLLMKIIYELTDRQQQRFAQVGIQESITPPPPPTFDGRS
jgi:hypothetical protein